MFKPKRVLFEKGTLDTEVGQNIYNMIKDDKNIEVIKLTSNKIKGNIPFPVTVTFVRPTSSLTTSKNDFFFKA